MSRLKPRKFEVVAVEMITALRETLGRAVLRKPNLQLSGH